MNLLPNHEDFIPHEGAMFRFDGWHGTLRLGKIEVQAGRQRFGSPHPPFTLIFQGPRDNVLSEGMQVARSDAGAAFAFYLMPIHTPASDRQDYQAVFN